MVCPHCVSPLQRPIDGRHSGGRCYDSEEGAERPKKSISLVLISIKVKLSSTEAIKRFYKIREMKCITGCQIRLSDSADDKNQTTDLQSDLLKTIIRYCSIMEEEKKKSYKCTKCPYESAYKSNLKTHILSVHEKVKNLQCHKCPHQASTSSNLKTHIKSVNDNIKDNVCNDCGSAFSRKYVLEDHIRIVHLKINKVQS